MFYVIIPINMSMNIFWDNVRSELSYQGKTQIELAKYCGLSVGTLRNKMNLQVLPTFEVAIKIGEFLKVSLEQLLNGIEYSGLSDEELALIIRFRNLSQSNKRLIKELIAALDDKK